MSIGKLCFFLGIFINVLPVVLLYESLESHQKVQAILKSDSYSNNIVPFPRDYTPNGAPPPPLVVSVNLALRDIEHIDDVKMELKLQVSLRQIWVDSRLQYSSSGDNDFITFNGDTPQKPWTPDLFIQNEKTSAVHSTIRPNSFLRIFSNGTVFYSVRISLTLACPMKLERFPFDKQTCHIQLSSHGYSNKTLVVMWDMGTGIEHIAGKDENKHLPQFRFVQQRMGRCLARTAAGDYSAVYFEMDFKRQLPYYISQFFIPCIMLNVVSWVAFWLGPAMEARLSLTVTVLLTLSTQIAGISQGLAPVSYTTGFTIFSGACLTFATVAILQSATAFYIRSEGGIFLIFGRRKVQEVVSMTDLEKGGIGFHEEKRPSKYSETTSGKIDQIASVVVPLSFTAFLVVYFTVYLWNFGDSTATVNELSFPGESENHYYKACKGWKQLD